MAVAAELNLPPGTIALFGLCVGHPDANDASAVKPRLPQSVVLHLERYDAADPSKEFGAYNDDLAHFQQGQGMRAQHWTDMVQARLGSIEALSGRHTLREALVQLGFPLR